MMFILLSNHEQFLQFLLCLLTVFGMVFNGFYSFYLFLYDCSGRAAGAAAPRRCQQPQRNLVNMRARSPLPSTTRPPLHPLSLPLSHRPTTHPPTPPLPPSPPPAPTHPYTTTTTPANPLRFENCMIAAHMRIQQQPRLADDNNRRGAVSKHARALAKLYGTAHPPAHTQQHTHAYTHTHAPPPLHNPTDPAQFTNHTPRAHTRSRLAAVVAAWLV